MYRPLDPRRRTRSFRKELVDGDDVWPDLSDAHLHELAAIDFEIADREHENHRQSPRAFAMAGGAIYSVAERLRHFRDIVVEMEGGRVPDPGVYFTELGCRSVVERVTRTLSNDLQSRLRAELLDPLDARFRAVTIDDMGELLRACILTEPGSGSWWSRRPRTLDRLWEI